MTARNVSSKPAKLPAADAAQGVTFRPFTEDDIVAAHRLSQEVKWPHRVDDWRLAIQAGEGLAAVAADGTLVGTGLFWRYGETAASLGLVIVSPDCQGQGIGRELMTRMLTAIGARTTYLHATPAGQPLYEKLGFERVGTIDQHQGTVFQPPLVSLPRGERLRPLGARDAQRIAALASQASGVDRSEMLPLVRDVADGIALDRDGELLGFALFRRFGRGYVVGPVVAPASATATADADAGAAAQSRARALISHWLARHEGVFVRIDTPGDSGLTQWLEGLGMPHVDTVIKMRRPAPATQADGPVSDAIVTPPDAPEKPLQYAIINQAFG